MTRNIGILNILVSDNEKEQTGPQKKLQEFIHCCCIDVRTIESYYPWNNRSKEMIKILKDKDKRKIICKRVPQCIWNFGLVW